MSQDGITTDCCFRLPILTRSRSRTRPEPIQIAVRWILLIEGSVRLSQRMMFHTVLWEVLSTTCPLQNGLALTVDPSRLFLVVGVAGASTQRSRAERSS